MAASTKRENRLDGSGDKAKGEPVSCEEHREALLDDALDDSFPASDPPAITRSKFKPC